MLALRHANDSIDVNNLLFFTRRGLQELHRLLLGQDLPGPQVRERQRREVRPPLPVPPRPGVRRGRRVRSQEVQRGRGLRTGAHVQAGGGLHRYVRESHGFSNVLKVNAVIISG